MACVWPDAITSGNFFGLFASIHSEIHDGVRMKIESTELVGLTLEGDEGSFDQLVRIYQKSHKEREIYNVDYRKT